MNLNVLILLVCIIFLTSCQSNLHNQLATKASDAVTAQASNQTVIFAEEGNPKYLGCWLGMSQGNIRFAANYFSDFTKDEKSAVNFPYREIGALQNRHKAGESYLLEVDSFPSLGCLNKLNVLTFRNEEEIVIYSYNSYEDYETQKHPPYCSFIKIKCD